MYVFQFSEFSINSTILHGNQYYIRHLHRFLASAPGVGEDSSWFLCYNTTSHGWTAKTFHDSCNCKRNTVTIIQEGQYVFGGYTDIPWGKIVFDCLSTCTFKRALVPRVFHDTLKILTCTVVPCNRVMISIIALALFVLYNRVMLNYREREIRLLEW